MIIIGAKPKEPTSSIKSDIREDCVSKYLIVGRNETAVKLVKMAERRIYKGNFHLGINRMTFFNFIPHSPDGLNN